MTNVISGMRQTARSAIRRIRRTSAYASAMDATDRVALRASSWIGAQSESNERSIDVVLCPPGAGNIGDQAMFEAYLDLTPGRIIAVTQSPGSVVIPPRHQDRVSETSLPGITGAGPVLRFSSTLRLASVLSRARTFAVVGADIMDGRYNLRSSLGRLSALRVAVRLGVPARVLGFSWSEAPAETAAAALRGLNGSVRLLARDPRTASRLREAGVAGVEEVSDIVFSSSRIAHSPEQREVAPDPFIVINASGLIPYEPLREDYGAVFRWAHEQRMRVVVLPHVIRAGANDEPVCVRMFNDHGEVGDVLIRRTFSPDEVRALVNEAEFVLTGRMHLAIMALSRGIPAATLSTVGKVEGLYDLFELPELATVPEPGFSSSVLAALSLKSSLEARLLSRLPEVRSLSRRNVESDLPVGAVAE